MEPVAIAIYRASGGKADEWPYQEDDDKAEYYRMARAAVEALIETSHAYSDSGAIRAFLRQQMKQ